MMYKRMTIGEAKEIIEKDLAVLCNRVMDLAKNDNDKTIDSILEQIEMSQISLDMLCKMYMNDSGIEHDRDAYEYLKLKRQEATLSPDVYLLIAFMQIHPETKAIGKSVNENKELTEEDLTPLNKTILSILPKLREIHGDIGGVKSLQELAEKLGGFNPLESAFFSAKHHVPDNLDAIADFSKMDDDDDDAFTFDFTNLEIIKSYVQEVARPVIQSIANKMTFSNDIMEIYNYSNRGISNVSCKIMDLKSLMDLRPQDQVSDDVRHYMNGVVTSINEQSAQTFILTALVTYTEVFGEYAEEIKAASMIGDSTTLNAVMNDAKNLFSEESLNILRKYATIIVIEKAIKEGENLWR